jgi:hypothetical protein
MLRLTLLMVLEKERRANRGAGATVKPRMARLDDVAFRGQGRASMGIRTVWAGAQIVRARF